MTSTSPDGLFDEAVLVKKLPMCLGDALDRLAEDRVIKAALPGDMYRVFSEYKRDE